MDQICTQAETFEASVYDMTPNQRLWLSRDYLAVVKGLKVILKQQAIELINQLGMSNSQSL